MEKFIKRIVSHSELSGSDLVATFLQADESGLAAAAEKSKQTRKPISSKATGWLEDSFNLLQNSGKKAEVEKSAADLQIEDIVAYSTALEKQMLNVTKHAENLVRAYRDDAKAINELGLSLTWLGQSEGDSLGLALTQVGTAADSASALTSSHAEMQNLHMSEPLDEYLRLIGSLKIALSNRTEKKSAYVTALTEVEVRQAAYNKLLGIAGKEDQANAKQELVLKAQANADACKLEYEGVSEKLLLEFDNFKYEKAVDIRNIILKFVEAQIDYHRKAEKIWGGLVSTIQTVDVKEHGGAAPRPPATRAIGDIDARTSPSTPFPPSSYMGVKPVASGSSGGNGRNPFAEDTAGV